MKKIITQVFLVIAPLLLLLTDGRGVTAFVVSSPSWHAKTTTTTTTTMTTRTTTTTSLNLFSFFNNNQKDEEQQQPAADQQVPEPVVIEQDFRVAALFLVIGAILDMIPYIQLTLGPLITALGILFLIQTFRLRFLFDETCFELATVNTNNGELEDAGENVIVGGMNRWMTTSIFNYDFFPQGWIDDDNHPIGPILVYFKEDQTPQDKWNEGPGQYANDPAKVEAGLVRPGQVHFFPAVVNSQQLRDEFDKRGCKKI